MDQDPVALQGGDERLDLLVGDERGFAHRDQCERDGEDADDAQAPFSLDDQVADHHRPGDEVQSVEQVRVGRVRDHEPEAVVAGEDVAGGFAGEDFDLAGGDPAGDEVRRVRDDTERGESGGGAVELEPLHGEAGGVADERGGVGADGHEPQRDAPVEEVFDRAHRGDDLSLLAGRAVVRNPRCPARHDVAAADEAGPAEAAVDAVAGVARRALPFLAGTVKVPRAVHHQVRAKRAFLEVDQEVLAARFDVEDALAYREIRIVSPN